MVHIITIVSYELYLRCVIMKYYKMLLYYANAIYTLFMHRATQQSSSYSILNTLYLMHSSIFR